MQLWAGILSFRPKAALAAAEVTKGIQKNPPASGRASIGGPVDGYYFNS